MYFFLPRSGFTCHYHSTILPAIFLLIIITGIRGAAHLRRGGGGGRGGESKKPSEKYTSTLGLWLRSAVCGRIRIWGFDSVIYVQYTVRICIQTAGEEENIVLLWKHLYRRLESGSVRQNS